MNYLKKTDPKIARLIALEEKRQKETLMMIPSENIASRAVEEAVGSCLGNKYAEGYPSRRYYQGQEIVDQIETLAIERAKKLFGVPAVNVQAHSGSPANFAVYTALLRPGDKLMGLSLSSGGHLTHGAIKNASSIYFRSVPYEVGKNGLINYARLRSLAKSEKPKIIIAGTTAYARIIDWKEFAEIANDVGAYLLADISHIAGLIIAGAYPSPVLYADVITTTTHKTLRGPRGALILTTKRGLNKDPEIAKKIDRAIIPGIQGGPHLNAITAIAVALKEASTKRFKKYAKQTVENAKILAKALLSYDFDLVTGGTDSHLILIDLRNKGLLGNTVAEGCEAANVVLNRNAVPYDPNPPFFPSGIRLGTPGITSRGMAGKEMRLIADYIHHVVKSLKKTKNRLKITQDDERKKELRKLLISKTPLLKRIKKNVVALCNKFPVKEEY